MNPHRYEARESARAKQGQPPMADNKNNDEEEALGKHLAEAAKLASKVATDARKQWSHYKDQMVTTAKEVAKAADKTKGPSKDERELMSESAGAAASLAKVFINFAEAVFEETVERNKETRERATDLVRKVVKLAVDDAFDATEAAPRNTRLLELTTDGAWQTVYLPRAVGAKGKVQIALDHLKLKASIHVRTSRNQHITLSNGESEPLEIIGSRPSLAFKVECDPKTVETPYSGLLLISGDAKLTLPILISRPPKKEADA